jgi:predicted nucleic acid-binding protein
MSRVVVDTNVVFEGLTERGGAAGLIIDAWLAGLLPVYVSNGLAYEYADVLSRKLSEARWQRLKPVLGTLLSKARFVVIYCAMNAGATVITSNVRDFETARQALGLRVMTPVEAALRLAKRV